MSRFYQLLKGNKVSLMKVEGDDPLPSEVWNLVEAAGFELSEISFQEAMSLVTALQFIDTRNIRVSLKYAQESLGVVKQ